MDSAFILMLFLTSISGLALLLWRETAAMGPLLALHPPALVLSVLHGKLTGAEWPWR